MATIWGPDSAYPGMAGTAAPSRTETAPAATVVNAGRAVSKDYATGKVSEGGATGFWGISRQPLTKEAYDIEEPVGVMRQGDVWAEVDAANPPDVGTQAGYIGTGADAGKLSKAAGAVLIPHATVTQVETTTRYGTVALVLLADPSATY